MSVSRLRRDALPTETMSSPETPPATTTVRIPQHVVHRTFVSETVVLSLATGKYYGVNPTGGRMLEVLERTPGIDEAAVFLAEEFAVSVEQVKRDLREFCEELADQGLLEIDAPGRE